MGLKKNEKMNKKEKMTTNENQKENRKIENDMKHYHHSDEDLAAGIATKSHYNNSSNQNKSPNPTPKIRCQLLN